MTTVRPVPRPRRWKTEFRMQMSVVNLRPEKPCKRTKPSRTEARPGGHGSHSDESLPSTVTGR